MNSPGPSVSHSRCVRLFVANGEPNSIQASENMERWRDRFNDAGYEVEVVDVLQQGERAVASGVYAAPALLVQSFAHSTLIYGTLQDSERIEALLSEC